eukprot:scaffold667_cov262-Pinguiococcus_pyrenoidosus.AAC.5
MAAFPKPKSKLDSKTLTTNTSAPSEAGSQLSPSRRARKCRRGCVAKAPTLPVVATREVSACRRRFFAAEKCLAPEVTCECETLNMFVSKVVLNGAVALALAAHAAALSTPFRSEPLNGAGLINVALDYTRSLEDTPVPVTSGPVWDAKQALKEALVANGGQTKTPEVTELLEKLSELNPTKDAAAYSEFMEGHWKVLSAPDFPRSLEQDEDGRYRYTLGQMSFNMYRPLDLVCTVQDMWQPIRTPRTGEDNRGYEYSFAVDVKLLAKCEKGNPLEAHMVNEGYCGPSEEDPNRLNVIFTKGYMRPCPGVNMKSWRETFGGEMKLRKRDRLSLFFGKLFMGLVPTGMENDGTLFYEVQRPPAGYLDILFLDDTMRVTRGNKGSIVVVERVD